MEYKCLLKKCNFRKISTFSTSKLWLRLRLCLFCKKFLKNLPLKNAGVNVDLNLSYTRLCKISGVILYVKVLHKKPNDICYSVFYFVWVGFDEKLLMYEVHFKGVARVSWGWSAFAIGQSPRSKTRNCRYTRTNKTESPNLHHNKQLELLKSEPLGSFLMRFRRFWVSNFHLISYPFLL